MEKSMDSDEKPPRVLPAEPSKFQSDNCVLGGRHTAGYDDFVRKIFQVNEQRPTDPSFLLDAHFPASSLPAQGIRASLQLRLENPGQETALLDTGITVVHVRVDKSKKSKILLHV